MRQGHDPDESQRPTPQRQTAWQAQFRTEGHMARTDASGLQSLSQSVTSLGMHSQPSVVPQECQRPLKRRRFSAQQPTSGWVFEASPALKDSSCPTPATPTELQPAAAVQSSETLRDQPHVEAPQTVRALPAVRGTGSKPVSHSAWGAGRSTTEPEGPRNVRRRTLAAVDTTDVQPSRARQERRASHEQFAIDGEDVGRFEPIEGGRGIGKLGQIVSLRAENFRNHEHIFVEFGPRLNFICGENGSGKSAILDGLQSCLGVGVKDIGRGQTRTDLMKDGTNFSKVVVVIWNTGADAVRPRTYGSKLTIRKEMRQNAQKSINTLWAILDEAGHEVSNRKSDVDVLLKALSINAASPVVCLTQAKAQDFASSRAEETLYSTYMEGLEFDRIMSNLKTSEEKIKEMKDKCNEVKALKKEKEARLKAAQKKMGELAELQPLNVLKDKLEKAAAWETVWEQLRWAAETEAQLQERAPGLRAKFTAAAQHAEQELETARSALHAQVVENEGQPDRISALRQVCDTLQHEVQQARDFVHRVRAQLTKTKRELLKKEAHVSETRETIQELKASHESSSQNGAESVLAALEEKRLQVEASGSAIFQAREDCNVAQALEREAHQGMRRCQGEKRLADDGLRRAQGSLAEVRAQQQGSTVTRFCAPQQRAHLERFLVALQQAERQGRFQRPVLGPVGRYLALQDEKWALAVEHAIGSEFNRFIVHSRQDYSIFKELAQGIPGFRVPGIVMYNFDHQAYDLSAGRTPTVPQELLTVLRAIRIQGTDYQHVISNILIDSTAAERIVLVHDRQAALGMIRGALGVRGVVSTAWAGDATNVRKRGESTTIFPLRQRLAPRLSRDMSAALARAQADLAEQESAVANKQAACREAQVKLQQAQQQVAAAKLQMSSSQARKAGLQGEADELRAQHESLVEASGSDLDTLGLQLSEATQAVQELRNQVHGGEQEVAAAKAIESSKSSDREAKKQETEQEVNKALESTSKLQQLQEEVAEKEHEKKRTAAELDSFHKEEEEVRANLKLAAAKAEEHRHSAVQVCPEEEAEEAAAALKPDIEKRQGPKARSQKDVLSEWITQIERRIQAQEQDAGANMFELEGIVAKLEKEVHKQGIQLQNVHTIFLQLTRSHNERMRSTEKMKTDTLSAVQHHFNANLAMRRYTGKLDIEDDERLVFKVKMGQDHNTVKDLKSLSGGERSFLNLCFIMAVGKSMSSPFHCMDEFDVYMDAVNRRTSLEMLLKFSAQQEDLQLFLLTPQSTHMIGDAEEHLKRTMPGFPGPDFSIMKKQMYSPRSSAADVET